MINPLEANLQINVFALFHACNRKHQKCYKKQITVDINLKEQCDVRVVMGPSPGPARARPGPVHICRDRARNFEKGSSSTQARDQFFEKGLENWDFYVVKNRG